MTTPPPNTHTHTHTHTVVPSFMGVQYPWADVGVIRTLGILPGQQGRQTMRQKVLKVIYFSLTFDAYCRVTLGKFLSISGPQVLRLENQGVRPGDHKGPSQLCLQEFVNIRVSGLVGGARTTDSGLSATNEDSLNPRGGRAIEGT